MWMAMKEIPETKECVLAGDGAIVLELRHELYKRDIARVCQEGCLVKADGLTWK
jgi:hypothetical protein